MALPLDDRQLNNLIISTLDEYRAELIDAYFVSNALMARLMAKNKVTSVGGAEIRSHFIYDKLNGGSYGRGDTFGTGFKEFMTDLRLDWKQNYVDLSMDGLDEAKNREAKQVFDYTKALKDTAKLTLQDNLGYQLYGDGSGNSGKDITGLKIAVNDTGTYGGVLRAATGPGAAIKSNVNLTGGPYNNSMVQNAIGAVTIGREQPDLIVTTQTIFNKIWGQSQPSERNTAQDLRKIGFRTVEISGADVVVDNHCPAGEMYLLNTNYLEWKCLRGFEMKLRGPFELHIQDAWTGQYITYGNLLCTSPRMCARIENIS